ncbi:MAG: hypothetical protein ABI208_03605 [Ginsengibacter sp.]|jgi:hypothetical protein
MKRILFIALVIVFSCNTHSDIPQVSSIKINLTTQRFEQDFFAIDTAQLTSSLNNLFNKYPHFSKDFISNLLGLSVDSVLVPNSNQQKAIRLFIHDYKQVKDASDKLYKNFDKETSEIKSALQFVKYYFPSYELPKSIFTFIAPLDANFLTSFGVQGDILTSEGLGIGLQLHLGSQYSLYNSEEGQTIYPLFISANFDQPHIVVNCMHNIVDDIFPEKPSGKPLIEQMVEKGRKQFLLTKFLPRTKENIILGYSESQMKEVLKNEPLIWDFFLKNDLLNNSEQDIIQNYISVGPSTPELGTGAPGNLGTFTGLQIVKKFMGKNPKTSITELMKMDTREIYSLSKYKPKI